MVKPEKFGHLHLVYHFTIALRVPYFSVERIYTDIHNLAVFVKQGVSFTCKLSQENLNI